VIMDNAPAVAANNLSPAAGRAAATGSLERAAMLYARFALSAAFLSAVADRFGLWGKYGGWRNFAHFTQYPGQVNSFMPAFIIPFLAWASTAAELALGIALIIGFWSRRVALGAARLLFLFGAAMAISFGIKSPLDYSVFSASAGALLLVSHREGNISSSQG
jgi:putative oxidoreductase